MKAAFSEDPGLSGRLFDLLDLVFPGIRRGAERARAMGAAWEAVSTPFVHVEEGRIVSHVGMIGLTLVLLGRRTPVGSVHAVATHPGHRRRGHFRRLMNEMIEDAAGRYETLILTTDQPSIYLPFDFRIVEEHSFTVSVDSTARSDGLRALKGAGGAGRLPTLDRGSRSEGSRTRERDGGASDLRTLDCASEADVSLLLRLLDTRSPVSRTAGIVEDRAVFCFNESDRPLHYVPDLDLVLCMDRKGARLELYDVVGTCIPRLDRLLECIPHRAREVVVHFAPDQLGVEATATPRVFDHGGPSYLMVRGPFAPEGHAFTLPRPART